MTDRTKMSPWEKVLSRPRIITIPMEDRYLLCEVGEILAGLGRDITFTGKRQELTDADVKSVVMNRIDEVNRRIGHRATEEGVRMPRRGPPPQERTENELETNTVVTMNQPLHLHKSKYKR